MILQERDIKMLEADLLFGFLVSRQLREMFFPNDKDGSVFRDRARKLEAAGLWMKRRAEVANPFTSNTMPCYVIEERGIGAIALYRDEMRFLNQKQPCLKAWQNYGHYVCVSDVMIKVRKCLAAQSRVTLHDMFFEHTVVNADEDDPAKRYKLYTIIQEQPKKIICAPDAAFELQIGEHRMAYYHELERGTNSPVRAANLKAQGFAGLAEKKKWKLHFPQAEAMKVLVVCPSHNWACSMQKAMRGKPGHQLWLFSSVQELSVENFLTGEIWYTSEGEKRPLVLLEGPPKVPPQR